MQNTSNGQRVCQQSRCLAHTSFRIDSFELASVQESIPAGQIDQNLIELGARIFKLGEPSPRPQVVVVFIDLPQSIANLEMRFIIIRPVLFTTICSNSTIWTFEVHMGGWLCALFGDFS